MNRIVVLFLFTLFGCKTKDVIPDPLTGIWQLVGGNDKIEFLDKTSLLKVTLRQPNQAPIIGEGLYFYTFSDNTMEVINSTSSCTCSKKIVYFKVFENNMLEIGGFYKSSSTNSTLKFRKQ